MSSSPVCEMRYGRRVGLTGFRSESTRAFRGSIARSIAAECGLDARCIRNRVTQPHAPGQKLTRVADQLDAVAVPPELHHAGEARGAAGVLQRDRVAGGGGRVIDAVEPVGV